VEKKKVGKGNRGRASEGKNESPQREIERDNE
jgi:hypothetical protein